MAKSTHQGHCQACGRLQMLPSGVLAKHGYKIDAGYFSGVCAGSGEFPYELSCELIGVFVERATEQLKRVEAQQRKLRKATDGPKAWFRVSLANPRGVRFQAVRRWVECTVTEETVTYQDGTPEGGSYKKFHRDGDNWSYKAEYNGKPQQSEVSAGYDDTLAKVCTKANRVYAEWLDAEVTSLKRYIAYQEQRIREWKVAPLFPVDHKDKLGFTPTAAPY